jgi:PhnB protein
MCFVVQHPPAITAERALRRYILPFFEYAIDTAIMKGPDGKPMHAELTLRGTTLMLGPEAPAMGRRSAKSVGASPASLYIYVENVDKVVEKATKLGASPRGPVMDMFWGDRCGNVVDPDGYMWMIGTHKAEPTAKEMKKGMDARMKQQQAGAAAVD